MRLSTNSICFEGICRVYRNAVVQHIRSVLKKNYPEDWPQKLQKPFSKEWDNIRGDAALRRSTGELDSKLVDEVDLLGVNHFYNLFELYFDDLFPFPDNPAQHTRNQRMQAVLTWSRHIKNLRDPALGHPAEADMSEEDAYLMLDSARRILKMFNPEASQRVSELRGSLRDAGLETTLNSVETKQELESSTLPSRNEIIRSVIQELQDGIGRTGWSVGEIEQTWLDRMHSHRSYPALPANIRDALGKVRARTAALKTMRRVSATHDHANYVREASVLRNDLATLIAVVECSRASADTVELGEMDGFANLKMRVRADFRNKDTTRAHYMRYVEVTMEVPDGRKLRLYQISGEILRDYCFKPGETRTDDIMDFQLHVADRLSSGEFESLIKNYGDWKAHLEICTAEGPTQYVDLEITGFLSKLVPNDPSKS